MPWDEPLASLRQSGMTREGGGVEGSERGARPLKIGLTVETEEDPGDRAERELGAKLTLQNGTATAPAGPTPSG